MYSQGNHLQNDGIKGSALDLRSGVFRKRSVIAFGEQTKADAWPGSSLNEVKEIRFALFNITVERYYDLNSLNQITG